MRHQHFQSTYTGGTYCKKYDYNFNDIFGKTIFPDKICLPTQTMCNSFVEGSNKQLMIYKLNDQQLQTASLGSWATINSIYAVSSWV